MSKDLLVEQENGVVVSTGSTSVYVQVLEVSKASVIGLEQIRSVNGFGESIVMSPAAPLFLMTALQVIEFGLTKEPVTDTSTSMYLISIVGETVVFDILPIAATVVKVTGVTLSGSTGLLSKSTAQIKVSPMAREIGNEGVDPGVVSMWQSTFFSQHRIGSPNEFVMVN
jgi:hypothetical protein